MFNMDVAAASGEIGVDIAARYVATGKLPHAQLLIARDGVILHRSTHGSGRSDGGPLAQNALFRIASMTKPVTAVAFMTLVEEGRVSLDDPLASVVPELGSLGVALPDGGREFETAPAGAIRMIDLLRHTAGLTYGFLNRTPVDAAYRAAGILAPGSTHDADGFVAALAALPLEFEPGRFWNYSVATDVLGVVVARLAGRSLGEVFAERIFGPLGMVDTGFTCPPEKTHRLTDAWLQHPGGRMIFDHAETSRWLTPPSFESGGGGLLSTIDDYHRFCTMLVRGGSVGDVRILSPGTLDLMTRNQLPGGQDLAAMGRFPFPETGAAGTGFGLGFAVTLDPQATGLPGSPGDFYWSGIYSTAFFVDPVERLHGIFMTQLMPTGTEPVRRELREAAYRLLR